MIFVIFMIVVCIYIYTHEHNDLQLYVVCHGIYEENQRHYDHEVYPIARDAFETMCKTRDLAELTSSGQFTKLGCLSRSSI